MIRKWNPNREVDGMQFERSYKDNSTTDTLSVHRSKTSGLLVLNCIEDRHHEQTNVADLLMEPEDAIAFAEWILANFKKGSK